MTDVLSLPGVARSASGSVSQYKEDALRSSGSERVLGEDSQQKPFRRILTRNRQYLETGYMHVDEAILQYMAKLEEHRRRWVARRSPSAGTGVAFVTCSFETTVPCTSVVGARTRGGIRRPGLQQSVWRTCALPRCVLTGQEVHRRASSK